MHKGMCSFGTFTYVAWLEQRMHHLLFLNNFAWGVVPHSPSARDLLPYTIVYIVSSSLQLVCLFVTVRPSVCSYVARSSGGGGDDGLSVLV